MVEGELLEDIVAVYRIDCVWLISLCRGKIEVFDQKNFHSRVRKDTCAIACLRRPSKKVVSLLQLPYAEIN